LKKHLNLVAKRFKAAKKYYSAIDRAAATLILVKRFNKVLKQWVKGHKKAVKAHKVTV